MHDFKAKLLPQAPKSGKQPVKLTTKQKILTITAVMVTVTFLFIIGGIIVTAILFAYFAKDLPSPYKLKDRTVEQATKIMDRNGKDLYTVFGEKNRELVTIEKIPNDLKNATIATEDKEFYKHKGFAVDGYFRIVKELIVNQRLIGGSSITQQLVKNTFLTPKRTPTRKLKELILAIQVEQRFSKNEILQMYMNENPYGGTIYGVQTASQTYFNKNVEDLTLTESAILAGLPQSPSYYSPYGDYPDAYKERTKYVLRRMREDKYITSEQEKKSIEELETLAFQEPKIDIEAPHFTLWIKRQLEEKYGQDMVAEGGLRVYTSLDLDIQNKVQEIVRIEVEKLAKAKVGNGAAMVTNPKTGEILAMVGSKDYFAKDYDGQFNVTLSRRQPGSATKPITYAVGFMKGYTPATMWLDVETEFDGGAGQPLYKPVNYDGKFRGPVQTRQALGSSLNIPAVKMLAVSTIKDTMQVSYDMGLSDWEPTSQNMSQVGLSLTLGGRELKMADLMTAYGVFANQGIKQERVSIIKVTDSTGKILEEFKPSKGRQILKPEIAYLISHILSDDSARSLAFGPRSLLYIANQTVAAKTGTTDEKKDNWAFGYNPSYVVGAWVGNNDNTAMDKSIASGVTGATPIWNKTMKMLLEGKKDEPFVKPDDVVYIDVDSRTGYKPGEGTTSTRKELFIKGTEPQVGNISQLTIRVCKGTNQAEKDGCDAEDKTYTLFTDPYVKEVAKKPGVCQGDCPEGDAYRGYTSIGGSSNSAGAPDISIRDIPDKANVPFVFNFTADSTPKGDAQISEIKLYLDDFNLLKTSRTSPLSHQVTFQQSQAGEHRLRVEVIDNKGVTSSKEITVNVR